MIISHLSLTNFRNYSRLELSLPPINNHTYEWPSGEPK